MVASTTVLESSGCGRWQARLALLLALPVLLTGMYGTNYVFLAAHVPYRCRVPECEGWANSSSGVPAEWQPAWARAALPVGDACRRWAPRDALCTPESFDNSTELQCEEFVYENDFSIFAEFNLACQEWRRVLVGTVHNVGMLISLPIVGCISDRFGRRTALVVAGGGAGLLGLAKSFATGYHSYLLLELAETVMGASVYPAAFVLMIEWLSVEQRGLASLILGVPLAAGAALLAALAAVVPDWRQWARVAYPPSLLLLLYPWLLPESLRWLAARGRAPEALRALRRAARCNGLEAPAPLAAPPEALHKQLLGEAAPPEPLDEEESLVKAFFKYRGLRVRLAVCGAWWVSAVFVFYGLAARAAALAGEPHANYCVLAAAELPALLLNTLLLPRAGRRALLANSFLLTALALGALPLAAGAAATALYVLGKLGATMTLNALYVYTAELFPTAARQRLLALCSMLGRLGAVAAPLTPLLALQAWWLPGALFALLPLASAALTPLLPDTLRAALPETFADLQRPRAPRTPTTPHTPHTPHTPDTPHTP